MLLSISNHRGIDRGAHVNVFLGLILCEALNTTNSLLVGPVVKPRGFVEMASDELLDGHMMC